MLDVLNAPFTGISRISTLVKMPSTLVKLKDHVIKFWSMGLVKNALTILSLKTTHL
jgi:hypothetical protein